MPQRHIAIYGGTFDPFTNAHGAIVDTLAPSLDEIHLVPCAQNPEKANGPIQSIHRLEMIRLAIADSPYKNKLKISNFETNNPPPSHTLDTIRHFKKQFPDDELTFIMGADSYVKFNTWKRTDGTEDWQEIAKLANIIVITRPGSVIQQQDWMEIIKDKVTIHNTLNLDISATNIRQALAAGDLEFANANLHPDVLDYILENELYEIL
jgi:nicotinate-nucleotide adenylyltransferase